MDQDMPNKFIEVLVVEAGEPARIAKIGSDLKSMQAVVGGDIEVAYFFQDPVCVICNDEGKINGMPLNRTIRDEDGEILDIIAGTFFICGMGEESCASLPLEYQRKYGNMFQKPEMFIKMGRNIVPVPM